MPQNWYSMTASKIYPLACAAGVPEEALATTTAKVCHQTQFWDGRSRFTLPLHAAKQMDLDQPQYRRTAAPQEKLSLDPGIEDVTAERTEEQEQ
jgi:RNaseH domain of pPIWI_RE